MISWEGEIIRFVPASARNLKPFCTTWFLAAVVTCLVVFQPQVADAQIEHSQQGSVLTIAVFQSRVAPFLKQYCWRCHGQEKQKADRRFDLFEYPIANDDALADFQDALDALNLGEMPPEEEPQPDDSKKAEVVAWMTAAIKDVQTRRASTGGETVLRRLNRREYRFTISDLFGLDIEGYDPTENFPADQQVHHLDNQGATLVTSGFLLNQYLNAADSILEKALPLTDKPEERTLVFDDGFVHQPEIHSQIRAAELAEINHRRDRAIDKLRRQLKSSANTDSDDFKRRAGKLRERFAKQRKLAPSSIRLYEHPNSDRHMGSYGYISELMSGVPSDGVYEITLDVQSLYRKPEYNKNYAGINSEQPMRLAIVPGDASYSDLQLKQPKEPELARFELADGRQTVSAKIWLHQGTTPRFKWLNGSSKMRSAHIELGKKLMKEQRYARLVDQKKEAGEPVPSFEEFSKSLGGNEFYQYGITHGKLPQIRIDKVTLRGPIFEQWPTPEQQQLLGGDMFDPAKNSANLKRFLDRAYRRAATDEEITQILNVVEARTAQGIAADIAYRDGLKAALCSPGFLYLEEPVDPNSKILTQHAIASRLSYFLWATLPDDELLDLAAAGELSDPKMLESQVHRMLADQRSDRFVEGFLNSWLALGQLGQAPPDRQQFSEFYSRDLGPAMRRETEMFARHILDNELSVDLFLVANFSFVNYGLAELYEMEFPFNDADFHQVYFADSQKSQRGGLLGQASVLTLTANGVDTSPIVRGVWLLENILGVTPSPPPPDVQPLDPDTRGAKTIRDQLEKHRSNATCAECHRKIDPLGFALENYDAIGRWREGYAGGNGEKWVKIDASAELASGEKFTNVKQFRELIAQNHLDKFARALTEKLMAYAIGRGVEIGDRPEIDAILSDFEKNDRQFRYLIKRIVMSPTFVKP